MVADVAGRIRRHRMASFFLLAYAIAWSLDLSVLALGMEPSWTRWIISGFLSALAPAVAGAVVLHASGENLLALVVSGPSGRVCWRVERRCR